MSIRSDLARAVRETRAGGNVVPFPKTKARARRRRMPPQGKRYDVQDLSRSPLLPGKYEDGAGNVYTPVEVNGRQYMRRSDGVWYKPMRDGRWTSMLTAPKEAVAAWNRRRVAKGVGVAAAGAVAANEANRRFNK